MPRAARTQGNLSPVLVQLAVQLTVQLTVQGQYETYLCGAFVQVVVFAGWAYF